MLAQQKIECAAVKVSLFTGEVWHFLLIYYDYSRTSRKRPPIMSRICGRLREVVAYQRSDHRGSKFLVIYIW